MDPEEQAPLIIIAVAFLILAAIFIYYLANDKSIGYDLCRMFFKAVSIIPGISPGSMACSGLR